MLYLAVCNGYVFSTCCANVDWAGNRAAEFPDTIYFEISSFEILHYGLGVRDYMDLRDSGLVP